MAKGSSLSAAVKSSGHLSVAPATATPSSSTVGFFQSPPIVHNQFYEDAAFQRAFMLYLPDTIRSTAVNDVSGFGARVLRNRVLNWVADAESHPPNLETWDIWGKRRDRLVTSEGWRNLQDMGIAEGIVAIAYENRYSEYSRLYQFLKYHLWTGSSAYVTCPSAMTDGAARLFLKHLELDGLSSEEREVFQKTYEHLVSRNPASAWTSGQWMTERIGGSDVRNTETVATYSPEVERSTGIDGAPLGPWLINGFKWFSSATDANMTILLAKTPDGGISAFYAPMRKAVSQKLEAEDSSLIATELNGIAIQRLKSKLGTRALPTAELSLTNTRAYLLGAQGQGVKEISTVLNITRVHNAVTACGLWGRGLAISRAFARVRSVRGTLLIDVPAHVRTMAKGHVEYRGYMLMTFFVVALLGISEQSTAPWDGETANDFVPRDRKIVVLLLRVLTPVLKALTAKAAIAGLAECMESLGGVGYLDSSSPLDIGTNIARLYRDANVLSIWEGTTDVMADDTIRVLKGQGNSEILTTLDGWISAALERWKIANTDLSKTSCEAVSRQWAKIAAEIRGNSVEELMMRGRELMENLGCVSGAVLLVEDANRDGDLVAAEVAKRWILRKGEVGGMSRKEWKAEADWDRRIVFGDRPLTKL